MPIVGRFGSLAGLGSLILPGGAMESIATVTVGSGGASSIEFTSIPGTYQHLQIRMVGKTTTTTGSYHAAQLRFNGVSSTSYNAHSLYGNGISAGADGYTNSAEIYVMWIPDSNSVRASVFGASIIDVLDYASTSKNTTVRTFTGLDDNAKDNTPVGIRSGAWRSTDAVTSITLNCNSGNFAQHTTAALYGLRAP